MEQSEKIDNIIKTFIENKKITYQDYEIINYYYKDGVYDADNKNVMESDQNFVFIAKQKNYTNYLVGFSENNSANIKTHNNYDVALEDYNKTCKAVKMSFVIAKETLTQLLKLTMENIEKQIGDSFYNDDANFNASIYQHLKNAIFTESALYHKLSGKPKEYTKKKN
jgi:hypothetical protein